MDVPRLLVMAVPLVCDELEEDGEGTLGLDVKVNCSYKAVVDWSQSPLKHKLTTLPLLRVIPSCRHVKVVPSMIARPVVPGTSEAVTIV